MAGQKVTINNIINANGIISQQTRIDPPARPDLLLKERMYIMNSVCLIGRLTKDIELKEYGKGKDAGLMARFTLAVQRDKETADFISCVAFGKTAELLDAYFVKGSRAGIEGRIQTGSYEDKDGNKRYTTDVIVSRVHFADALRAGADNYDEPEDELPPDWQKKEKSGRTNGRSRR